ncbi:MAG: chemotaxis protein CheW [Candidatus Pacebacteria bacterium]|nr:chemotaxis protein CheW [Candidatus Paceibacterota bacterium]
MDDLLSEFLTETNENLSVLDSELIKLEQNPNDPELLGNIFRLVHTIKGTCGFLGLPRLEKVAHASENVLGEIRSGNLLVDQQAVTLILESLDCIKSILLTLEKTEAEPEGDDSSLIQRLNDLAQKRASAPTPAAMVAAPAKSAPSIKDAEAAAVAAAQAEIDRLLADDFPSPPPAAPAAPPAAVAPPVSQAPVSQAPVSPPQVTQPPAAVVAPAPSPAPQDDFPPMAAASPQPHSPEPIEVEGPAAAGHNQHMVGQAFGVGDDSGHGALGEHGGESSAHAAQSIRVSVELLENLMTMVSELVLTRNQLLQIVRRNKESEFAVPLQRLSQVTSELQEGVMKTRMQPVGNAWAKLPRLIRDLSLELNKKIELQMLGAETELDRQVLEYIKDPLTHMVRNSADHGIEPPDVRVAIGKPEMGRITLNAFHEGGHILIEISDDGKGLDIAKIRQKIVQSGLALDTEVQMMSDQHVMQYIFRAGFSTASRVTAVSGRGVGMDVVRTNIEKIGGTIEMSSRFGRGSTFTIKIPLTLAIVSALIVESCGERFAVPQISVVELVRAASQSEHKIERIHGTPVLRLRERLLPLVSLEKVLRLDREVHHAREESFIIVAQVGTYNFGIMVDRVFDTEEIVVKPVSPILRHLSIFSGNTILGDGSVIMILDPNGVASSTGEVMSNDQQISDQSQAREIQSGDRTTLLIFRAGGATPKAVPLSLVARLEEIDNTTVEHSNSRPMVQYRGRLMPLIMLDSEKILPNEGRTPVLVFSDESRSMGLVVDEIVDIIEDVVEVELLTDRPGLMGSAIIAGHATDVIDAGYYLIQAYGDWFGNRNSSRMTIGNYTKKVLLVDDSPFFRNLLTPLLSVAGFEVTAVESPKAALQIAEKGFDFDIIVSDIEMPVMNGFEFARVLRNHPRWSKTPLIALSAHTAPEDMERGRESGFNDYVPKFDRDALVRTLNETLMQRV